MNYNPNNRPINQSRRPKLDMDDEWNAKFLNKIKVGHISTRDGNQPFINPTSFWYSKEDHEIYFHSNAVGRMRFNAIDLGDSFHLILPWKLVFNMNV